MIVFLNFLQDLTLVLFILSAIYVMIQDRCNVYGAVARKNKHEIILNGSQGVDISVGRQRNCDITIRSEKAPKLSLFYTYDGTTVLGNTERASELNLGDDIIGFIIPSSIYLIRFKLLPVLLTIVFLVLRYFSLCQDFKEVSKLLLLPFVILIVYLLISLLLNVNASPIIESTMAILLSYNVYASIYKTDLSNINKLNGNVKKSILSVAIYVVFALVTRLFITYFPFRKQFDIHGLNRLNRFKPLIGYTLTPQDILRFMCVIGIFILIVMNIVLGKLSGGDINGAYNWIEVGEIQFQPSEFIKPLFLIMLMLPLNKRFSDILNLLYMFIISGCIFLYALYIKDVGFLMEMAVVWFFQIIIFSNSLSLSIIMSSAVVLGVKIVLRISTTASARLNAWLSDDILSSFFSQIIEKDPKGKGYQPLKALTGAVVNGRAFGRKYVDIDLLKSVTASDNDLVTSILSQRYGYITLFLLIMIIVVILVSAIFNMRKQSKNQQSLSMMACVLMSVAYILNIGGTYGVLPLTGIVAPGLSRGMSAAVSYGACFGFLTAVSPYIRNIFRNRKHYYEFKKGKLLTKACTVPAIEKSLDVFSNFDVAIDKFTNNVSDKIKGTFKRKGRENENNVLVIKTKKHKAKPSKNKPEFNSDGDKTNKKKLRKWIGIIALILVGALLISVFGSIGKALSNINHRDKAEHFVAAEELVSNKNVFNVLLLGVDARSEDEDESSRADTMLMVSVDKNNKSVKMTSFLRDSWVYIPARKSKGRLNSASSYGGYSAVVDAIEYNFGVGVDGYAVVDFEMFKVLVNAIGGVTINVTEKEANEINKHPKRYNKVTIEAGEHLLNGEQALAYARIRKIDTDFMRTKRQRTVLNAIIQKAKSQPFKFLRAMGRASAYIETDLTNGELVNCGMGALKCSKHIYQNRVPFGDGGDTWKYATINGASVIKINVDKNRERLIQYIYKATPEELE